MALLCLGLCIALTGALAQVDTGTIAGTVRDSQGATVANAAVTIVDVATNATVKTNTDSTGDFVSPPLKPGTYKVAVEAPGFKTQTRPSIVVQVQDRLRLDFDMAVGAVSENVLVTAETPAIQSETSSLGEVVAAKQIEDLPLNGRDYVQLATLTTGVVRTSSGTNGNTGGSSTGGVNSFVANGTRGTLNNFILDGIDNNSNDNGGVVLRTNVDAIQEFKLQTNSYSAEFGRSGGAVVNAVLKSGSNSFHGTLFEFFRNAALDARDYFELPGTKKASFKQNQFGGTIGGPIVKDKLFFFGDYQGTRIRNPLTFSSKVPLPAQRTGDFSAPGDVSQSGETADTLATLRYAREQKQHVMSIVNVATSTIARESDVVMPTLGGPEIGVASTKAFTCQLTVLACLAIAAGRARGVLDEDDETTLVKALIETPRHMAEALALEPQIERLARDLAKSRDVLYLGRGTSYPLALEGALKLKEISYIHAEGYAAGELKHGPIALIDETMPVVVIAPYDRVFEKTVSNMQEVAARGGRIILMTDPKGARAATINSLVTLTLPDMPSTVTPLVYAIPVQLIAYHTAVIMGTDVDQPRNLAKSVTVE